MGSAAACFPKDWEPPEGEVILREIGARHSGFCPGTPEQREEREHSALSAMYICLCAQYPRGWDSCP